MIDIDQARLKELFHYDGKSGYLIRRISAGSRGKAGDVAGCLWKSKSTYYYQIMVDKTLYYAHQLIYLYNHGYIPKEIDHVDGDGTNNILINLRDVTHQENNKNMKRSRRNTSGHTGISWSKGRGKWESNIHVDGKNKHLGMFLELSEAVKARKEAELKYDYHPNHGRQND